MCSVFAQLRRVAEYQAHFAAEKFLHKVEEYLKPNYRLRPRSVVLSVVQREGERCLNQVNWGFKSGPGMHPFINARSETLAEKKTFRQAYLERRCLVPVDGFYEMSEKNEWYFLRLKSKAPMAVAGLYRDEKDGYQSCTFVTCAANTVVARAQDRMPVVLDPEAWAPWLDPGLNDESRLSSLLKPYPARAMEAYRVRSPLAKNGPDRDSPALIEPAV